MFIYSYHIETHYLVLTYSVGLSPATVIMCFNIIHHRKTHSVLIRHLQESNLLPQILGLYQRTNALGLNVFIYDEIVNRICTCAHSTFSPLDSPTKLSPYRNTLVGNDLETYLPTVTKASNVFLYGRTAGTRTQNWQIKSLL